MESQLIHEIQKNETEQIRISTRTYKDRLYLDLRLFFKPNGSEEYVPSKKGLTLGIEYLPALKEGIEKAVKAVTEVQVA